MLSFLILNIYLLVQFTEKQEQADLSVLEHTESTIEDQLEAENIKIPNLSNKKYNETFISVAPKLIVNDELKKLKELRSEERRVGKGVEQSGRRVKKKKKRREKKRIDR